MGLRPILFGALVCCAFSSRVFAEKINPSELSSKESKIFKRLFAEPRDLAERKPTSSLESIPVVSTLPVPPPVVPSVPVIPASPPVVVAPVPPPSVLIAPAPAPEVPPPPIEEEPPLLNVKQSLKTSNNISAGVNYVFPTFHLQRRVFGTWSLGLAGSYVNYPAPQGSSKGSGGFVSLNYYDMDAFSGVWVCLGGGIYDLTAESNGVLAQIKSPVTFAAFGWRWMWDSEINFGFSGGISYLWKPANKADVNLSNVIPAILMDFGFAF